MRRSSGREATASQRTIPAADDLDVGVAAALKRVLDEASDILLVLDHEHPRHTIHRCDSGCCWLGARGLPTIH